LRRGGKGGKRDDPGHALSKWLGKMTWDNWGGTKKEKKQVGRAQISPRNGSPDVKDSAGKQIHSIGQGGFGRKRPGRGGGVTNQSEEGKIIAECVAVKLVAG